MKEYFQYLIWMMLFVIIMEMFFPDSSYKKYIKLVLGCILLYTMLSPIVKLIKVDGKDYESYVKAYQTAIASGTQVEMGRYEENLKAQQVSMEKMYEESIRTYVTQQFDVSVEAVEVIWAGDHLEGMRLTVGRKTEGISIGTIKIGDKSETADGAEAVLKNKIKTCLADFYNVQVDNIYITVQKS